MPARGHPRPNRPATPWTPNGTTHSLQSTKDAAGRVLNSLRQGRPKISGKDFKTLHVLNMAKTLRNTATLLENTEKEGREPAKGRTPPRTLGSDLPTANSLSPTPILIRDQYHGSDCKDRQEQGHG